MIFLDISQHHANDVEARSSLALKTQTSKQQELFKIEMNLN